MAFTDINSEDRLVQQTFADHLHQQLGWDSIYAHNAETFGPQLRIAFALSCQYAPRAAPV